MKRFLLPLLLVARTFTTAQNGTDVLDPATLITQHYGGAAKGTPPTLSWTPQGEDAKHFDDVPVKSVRTTVDTVLAVGDDVQLVFFRTTIPQDADMGEFCELCVDHLGVARYRHTPVGYVLEHFDKWFLAQGVYEGAAKPSYVIVDGKPVALLLSSSDGDMVANTRTDHYMDSKTLQTMLTVLGQEYTETRGGDDGPMMSMITRTVRFVPDAKASKEHCDVQITTQLEEGEEGTVEDWTWPTGTDKYAPQPKTTPAQKK